MQKGSEAPTHFWVCEKELFSIIELPFHQRKETDFTSEILCSVCNTATTHKLQRPYIYSNNTASNLTAEYLILLEATFLMYKMIATSEKRNWKQTDLMNNLH